MWWLTLGPIGLLPKSDLPIGGDGERFIGTLSGALDLLNSGGILEDW